MFISKKKYNDLKREYESLVNHTNRTVLKGNDRIVSAENELRHTQQRLLLSEALRKQAEVAKQVAREDGEQAFQAFRTLHRAITLFRADPSRTSFRADEIKAIEGAATRMGQSTKEWLNEL